MINKEPKICNCAMNTSGNIVVVIVEVSCETMPKIFPLFGLEFVVEDGSGSHCV